MMLEEYCGYILSRNKELEAFTIPGSKVQFDKSELLSTMREVLRDKGSKDYDSLLVNTLKCYVSKDYLDRNHRFDANMDAILGNIRKRVELICMLREEPERPLPFSYERIFEILVYYLRIATNALSYEKEKTVHYSTAEITPQAVINAMNRKLDLEDLDAEWEEKRWKMLFKDATPFYASMVDNYLKFMLLATYIRYCEIKGK